MLREALDNASNQQSSFNMESLVEELLSSELLAQLDSDVVDTNPGPKSEWSISTSRANAQKKAKTSHKQERIVLGDVRQRQLMTTQPDRTQTEQLDPWTQLSSIAEYISKLLRCPASALLSTFHSPDHPTTFHAVASYIQSMAPSKLTEEEVDQCLISISEIMSSEDDADELDAQWARKCIHVTDGRLSDTIDLYELLMSLEELGPINHLPAPARISTTSLSSPSSLPSTSTSPQQRGNGPRRKKFKYPAPKSENVSEWQVVKKRVPKVSALHPHAEFIPSYRNLKAVPAWTLKQATDDVKTNREIEQGWADRRIEALRKASQHWQRSQGGYGHQVAGYYAEEANKYLRESRMAAVEAARALVVRNR